MVCANIPKRWFDILQIYDMVELTVGYVAGIIAGAFFLGMAKSYLILRSIGKVHSDD